MPMTREEYEENEGHHIREDEHEPRELFLNQNHCPECQSFLSIGNTHGEGFVAGYKYCHECDEFVEFDTHGLNQKRQAELKNFLRTRLKEAEAKNEKV
jgi:hypothetical protein